MPSLKPKEISFKQLKSVQRIDQLSEPALGKRGHLTLGNRGRRMLQWRREVQRLDQTPNNASTSRAAIHISTSELAAKM